MNKNVVPSEVTDNVEDKRGDAFRGIPKLSCLDIPWILTWGALGSPKIRVLSLLILLISISHPKLENFNHTKLNKTFVRSVSIIKQIIHFGTVKTRFIIFLTLCLLYPIISTIYIKQYKP